MRGYKRWCIAAVAWAFLGPWGCVQADDTAPRLRIATWNVEWFYDHERGDNTSDLARSQSAPSAEAWRWKVTEVARVVAALDPHILALQEIEGRRVLDDLVDQLREQHELHFQIAFLEGGDTHTEQDVAVLYRGAQGKASRRKQTAEMFASNQFFNVQKHLFVRFHFRESGVDEQLTLLTAHLRAGPEQKVIRRRQSNLLHTWVRDEVRGGHNVVVLGDFNTDVRIGEASAANDIGVLSGLGTEDRKDDLLDLLGRLPERQQATHITGRSLDRMLVSSALMEDAADRKDWVLRSATVRRDLVVRGRGRDRNHFDSFWKIPAEQRDVSDHYPILAEFELR